MPTNSFMFRIYKILMRGTVLVSFLFSTFGTPSSTAQAQGSNQTFIDPLYGYKVSIPPGWNIAPPKINNLTKQNVLVGVTVIQNYDLLAPEKQPRKPQDLKIQIGIGPMSNPDFLDWVEQRIWNETSSPDFIDFNYQHTEPEAISLGTLQGYAFTVTSPQADWSVMEIDLLLGSDLVVSIGLSPSDSPNIPAALAMLSTLDFSAASVRADDFHDTPSSQVLLAELIEAPASETSQEGSAEADVIHPPGWGSEAPDSPITLYMPFHDGETWQVGGTGYFYGDGTHTNFWNDYYATDWNRPSGDDLGKDVLPVAGGNVVQRQIAPCPTTGFGCYVKIDHGSGITTLYAHLSTVSRGLGGVNHWDVIGQVGSSGNSTGPHLHLRFHQNGYSTCRNNGNTCPNGESPAAQQSSKPSPMNTQQGTVQLNDGYSYTSNNKEDSGPVCPSLSGEVRLYDFTNCGGDWTTANGTGLWSMASSFNDRAESIALPGGWSARLYLHDSESSPSACFTSTDTNLGDNTFSDGTNVANQATWMRVYDNSTCSGGNPPSAPTPSGPSNGQYFNEGESINLSWSATGNEYYGEVWGGPSGTLTFGWQSGTTKNIGSQWAGYTYNWHVKSRNNYGESAWSNTWSFTIRPGAPSSLNASAISCSQINLSWIDNSGNEEGYKVYRNGNLIATLGSGTTSYQDTGLAGNTSYSYSVKSYRASIESNSSNSANATTTTCPAGTPILISPSNGQFFNEGDAINLSWSASGNEYYGEIWGGPGGTLTFGWQSGTTKNIGSQWAGYAYSWHVKARNGASESGWSDTWTFTVRPGAPSNLSASAVSCSQVNLSWNDNSGNEEGYKVYRDGNLVATLGSSLTSYQNTGLSGNTTYSYTVKAYRGGIESNSSNTASATTEACPAIPNTPSNLRVSSSTPTSITIAWDDVGIETGYKIYEWNGSSFVYLASVQANVTSFTETRGTCGWDEFYEVSAYNGNGESPHTAWVHGYTEPCPPAPSAQFDAWPLSGPAPLTVSMHIVDTSNMTTCSWDYGDGSAPGTSCASLHDHTYTSPGTYTVTFTATGPAGTDSMTRTGYIVVTGSGPDNSIFADDFETGNSSRWTSCTTDGGDLSVVTEAKHAGAYGMKALIDDNISIYCTSDHPEAESRYLASFFFNPHSIPMTSGDAHVIFGGHSGTTIVLRIQLRYYSGNYQLQASLLNDGSTWKSSSWYTVSPNEFHQVQLDWKAASGVGANDGSMSFWIDGAHQVDLTGVDNDTRRIDRARLGAVNAIDTGTRGTYYFDDFQSSRGESGPSAITADFSASSTTGLAPLTVYFTNMSQPESEITGYLWDFGDGFVSGAVNPTHEYTAAGAYTVSLTAYGQNQQDIETKTDYIQVLVSDTEPPTISWVAPVGNEQVYEVGNEIIPLEVSASDNVEVTWVYFYRWDYVNETYIQIGGTGDLPPYRINFDTSTLLPDWNYILAEAHDSSGNVASNYIWLNHVSSPDLIFADSFETCDLSNWLPIVIDGGDLSANTAAKLVGNCGMQAIIDDNVSIYVTDVTPNAELRYRARFYFDPNSITMVNGNLNRIFYGYSGTSKVILRVEFRRYNNAYQLRVGALTDGSTWKNSSWYTISDAPHYLEFDWQAATGVGANDGSLTFWIDGAQKQSVIAIDNDTLRIDQIRLGAVNGIDSGTRGRLFFDHFEARRETYIGP